MRPGETCDRCVFFRPGDRFFWDRSGRCYRYPEVVERERADRFGCGEFVDAYPADEEAEAPDDS